MSIAVISALQTELELLIETLQDVDPGEIAGWPTWTGQRSGHHVVLARAGLGKVNTAALSALVWERFRPSLLVFTGVAGALDPSLSVGDVVVAERSIQHDAGVLTPAGLERYQAGHVPFFNPTEEFGYAPTEEMLQTVRRVIGDLELSPVLDRVPSVTVGTIVTGDQFLQDTATRDRLFTELGAQAIEMEGAALAQFASRVGCDHVVIRSLSDLAGESSTVDFERYLSEAASNSARLTGALIDRLQEHDRDLTAGP